MFWKIFSQLLHGSCNAPNPLDGFAGFFHRTGSLVFGALVLVVALMARKADAGHPPPQERSSPTASASTQQQLERGKELMVRGKFAEAAEAFRVILSADPRSPFLYNLLGFCTLQQGLRKEAETYFKKALELDPGFKPARNNLGGIYLLEGRWQEAAKEFLALTQADPRDAQAYFNLARAELAAKQKEAGLQHLRVAYGLAPGNLPVAMALAHLYLEQGPKQLGEPIVANLAASSPSDAKTELELGGLLLSYGKEDAAIEHLRRAQGAEPKAGEVLYALAADHFRNHDYKAALRLLEMTASSMQN